MNNTRRAYLSLIASGTLGLSGCSAADDIAKVIAKGADDASGGARVADDAGEAVNENLETATSNSDTDEILTDEPEQTARLDEEELNFPIFSVNQTIELTAGNYHYWEIDLLSDAESATPPVYLTYTIIVRNGPAVDVIFTDQNEFAALEDGDRFAYFQGSSMNTQFATEDGPIEEFATYYLVIDNSRIGDANPDGYSQQTAEVDVEVTITDEPQ